MKYPNDQYQVLLRALKLLSGVFHLAASGGGNEIHYIVFQQMSPDQPHNHIYYNSSLNQYARMHQLENMDLTGWVKLVDIDFDFKCYPAGCNEDHVTTAMKRALKEYQFVTL